MQVNISGGEQASNHRKGGTAVVHARKACMTPARAAPGRAFGGPPRRVMARAAVHAYVTRHCQDWGGGGGGAGGACAPPRRTWLFQLGPYQRVQAGRGRCKQVHPRKENMGRARPVAAAAGVSGNSCCDLAHRARARPCLCICSGRWARLSGRLGQHSDGVVVAELGEQAAADGQGDVPGGGGAKGSG
jgi:hypothetical protein